MITARNQGRKQRGDKYFLCNESNTAQVRAHKHACGAPSGLAGHAQQGAPPRAGAEMLPLMSRRASESSLPATRMSPTAACPTARSRRSIPREAPLPAWGDPTRPAGATGGATSRTADASPPPMPGQAAPAGRAGTGSRGCWRAGSSLRTRGSRVPDPAPQQATLRPQRPLQPRYFRCAQYGADGGAGRQRAEGSTRHSTAVAGGGAESSAASSR
jgi:hypothetical protein